MPKAIKNESKAPIIFKLKVNRLTDDRFSIKAKIGRQSPSKKIGGAIQSVSIPNPFSTGSNAMSNRAVSWHIAAIDSREIFFEHIKNFILQE